MTFADPVDSQAEMTSRWVVRQCPYCDDHGYLPGGHRCLHESPEVTADRARRGAQLARTALAETAARLDHHQPEQEPA